MLMVVLCSIIPFVSLVYATSQPGPESYSSLKNALVGVSVTQLLLVVLNVSLLFWYRRNVIDLTGLIVSEIVMMFVFLAFFLIQIIVLSVLLSKLDD